MHTWLYQDDESEAMLEARAQARAHFGVYARGEKTDDRYFMSRVEDRRRSGDVFSHGVWAMATRFDPPPPQFRYFGVFAVMDFFVVLTKQDRDLLEESPERWHAEIDKALSLWNELLPGHHPWVRDSLQEYISRNVEKRDERW